MSEETPLSETTTQHVADPEPTTAPVAPKRSGSIQLEPVGLEHARISGGFWSARQRRNRDAISAGKDQLEEAGNLAYFRVAAGISSDPVVKKRFVDAQVYKWLEAVAWEYARHPAPQLLTMQREVTGLVAAAQEEDGYLNVALTVGHPDKPRYSNLASSHELFCAGHLFQAAVAQIRCTGDRGLLEVAIRLADHLCATFGEERRHDIDGHPLVETALAELYRETRNARYLELARYFVEARGHGLIESYGQDPVQSSDRVPVREASTVEGHAVKAIYLATGATDVATELGDDELLASVRRQFHSMWSTKTHLTGGLGSRWHNEAFGNAYELPADRAYAETCAAIGGIQWAWRLLLATGDPSYAEAMERILFNAFLGGVAPDGCHYFYVNPLQLRADAVPDTSQSPAHGRRGWFHTACCPPNVMRMLASLAGYMATQTNDGIQLHQFAAGDFSTDSLALHVETDYPWDGLIRITISESRQTQTALSVRIPSWAKGASVTLNSEAQSAEPGTYFVANRNWQPGDTVDVMLPMAVRHTYPASRIEALAGTIALERGPLVYAFEQTDQPTSQSVADLQLIASAGNTATHDPNLLGGVTVINAKGMARSVPSLDWPYETEPSSIERVPTNIVAIPYFGWANRQLGAMKVWLPVVE